MKLCISVLRYTFTNKSDLPWGEPDLIHRRDGVFALTEQGAVLLRCRKGPISPEYRQKGRIDQRFPEFTGLADPLYKAN